MEEGQRLTDENGVSSTFTVLILVVMEEGQRPPARYHRAQRGGLNPCCNGRGSKTPVQTGC